MREAPSRVLLESLWSAGASVRAYDPVSNHETPRLYGDRADLLLCVGGSTAAEGADAFAIVTEWQEFRSPDFETLARTLRSPVISDGRNLYDPQLMTRLRFTYYAVGRGDSLGRPL
jgi:UDPglucose 6-dehydrogenase